MVRAGLVLVVFVVATVGLLRIIHPSASSGAAGSTSNPSTVTTIAGHASTTTTTTIPASRVSVLVANASGVTGAAEATTTKLQPGGWNLLTPVNATAQVTASNVYYVAGYQRPALAVATSLKLAATSVVPYTTSAPISTIGTAQVLVVVGPDLADRVVPTASTASTAG